MNKELRIALTMMGYRPLGTEVSAAAFGKPIGYSLVAVIQTEQFGIEFLQAFWNSGNTENGVPPHPIFWSRKKLEEDSNQLGREDFVCWIKECENWYVKTEYCGSPGAFEFLTLSQQFSEVEDM